MKCMSSEHNFYPSRPPSALCEQPPLNPSHLPVAPKRFRDNINGIKYVHTPIAFLRRTFEALYNLNLQQEGYGPHGLQSKGTWKYANRIFPRSHHRLPYDLQTKA